MPQRDEYEDDLDSMFGDEARKEKIDRLKQQRWRTNFKYTDAMPVVLTKPSGIYRFYPGVDPDSGQLLPYVENGRLTWLTTVRGVDYLGIRLPSAGMKAGFSLWIIPSDMEHYFGTELASLEAPVDKLKFMVQRCPYSYLYHGLRESADDPDAPAEWAVMEDQTEWRKIVHDGKTWAPLSKVEVHAVVRGAMLENGNKTYTNESYEDGRSPGAIHPIALEFKASATRALVSQDGEFRRQRSEASGDNEENLYVYSELIDPKKGRTVRLVTKEVDRSESQGSYNVHDFIFKGGIEHPVDPDEILREWHPYRVAAELGGETRKAIIRRLPCEKQISLFLTAFDQEIVDYCFRRTPYWDLLPPYVKGSYDSYISKYRASRRGHWLDYIADRARGREAQDDYSEPPQKEEETSTQDRFEPSRKKVQTVLSDASEQSGNGVGGYDDSKSQTYRSLLDRLDEDGGGVF